MCCIRINVRMSLHIRIQRTHGNLCSLSSLIICPLHRKRAIFISFKGGFIKVTAQSSAIQIGVFNKAFATFIAFELIQFTFIQVLVHNISESARFCMSTLIELSMFISHSLPNSTRTFSCKVLCALGHTDGLTCYILCGGNGTLYAHSCGNHSARQTSPSLSGTKTKRIEITVYASCYSKNTMHHQNPNDNNCSEIIG